MPWQRELFDVAYEYDPVSGLYRYDEVDATVPRQSGKTTVTLAKKVHRLTVVASREGPQRATYTAQTRTVARKKLERDFAEALRSSRSFVEIERSRPSKPVEWHLSLNNGQEHIQFGRASYLQIDAPSRTGGHGDTLDDGTIDEAFKHEDDTVEAGIRPSMATRRNAQLWVISTAGDERSRYLYQKVIAGRAAAESGAHGRVCYVEYSAPDEADPGDPRVWQACMPALGFTITGEFIRGEWERAQRKGADGIDTFRRAYLNQWPKVPVLDPLAGPSAFRPEQWKAAADPGAERGFDPVFGVAVAKDQSWAAVAVAWERPDGGRHVMLTQDVSGKLDYRPGTAWVPRRVEELRQRFGARVLCNAAARGLVADADLLTEAHQAEADNRLGRLLEGGLLGHGNQGALNTAVRGSQWRPRGASRVLEPKGEVDISPIQAASVAVHGVGDAGPSLYESRGFLSL